MPDWTEAARWAAAAVMVLLALRGAYLARTRRFPGTAWLATAFGLLGAGLLCTRVALAIGGSDVEVALRVGRATVIAYPVALLWFVHAVSPVGLLPRVIAAGGAGVGVLAMLLGPAGGAASPALSGVQSWAVYVAAMSGWMVAHGVAAGRLLTAARAAPASVYSRRVRSMAAGSVVLGVALLLVPIPNAWIQAGLHLAGIAAALLFWTGVDPPEPLRILARHHSTETLRTVERGLLRATSPDDLGFEFLSSVASIVGGDAVLLVQSGAAVGRHGLAPADAADLARLLPAEGDGVQLRIPDSRDWLVAAPTGAGWLAVRTGPFTPIFGTDELTLLEQLAHEVGIALERVRVQEQEHDSLRRLETAERLRDDLLSTVSHELRTPLTSIRGFAAMLAARWDACPEDQRRAFFDRIVNNTHEMEQLVDGLLRLSQMRASGSVAAIDSGHLTRVVEQAVLEVGAALDAHDVLIEVAPVPLRTDLRAIRRIVAQFLRNAAAHTPPGTAIVVHGAGDDSEARIAVTDQGPGLSPDDLRHVFEPFYRGGDVLTRHSRGAGIGLALARERAAALGGTLSVSSERGAGATFVLSVPRTHPEVRATVTEIRPVRASAS